MAEISNLKVEVWEVYKIHSSFPVSILRYANFSSGESKGDEIAEGEKWQRRRNLQVSGFPLPFHLERGIEKSTFFLF